MIAFMPQLLQSLDPFLFGRVSNLPSLLTVLACLIQVPRVRLRACRFTFHNASVNVEHG